jgi:hypothetical protein
MQIDFDFVELLTALRRFFVYPDPPAGGERRKSIYFRKAEWGK